MPHILPSFLLLQGGLGMQTVFPRWDKVMNDLPHFVEAEIGRAVWDVNHKVRSPISSKLNQG